MRAQPLAPKARAPDRARDRAARPAAAEAPPSARARAPAKPAAAIGIPPLRTLAQLAEAEHACTRCPLYKDATQAVPGEGPTRARMMLVGEQPGDQEDQQGRPFVGPAGKVLDRALAEAGIERETVFLTNAVKHFKWEPRGKRRLHKKPNTGEIDACRAWAQAERALVKPAVIVALGATAARSVLGRSVTIAGVRGEPVPGPDGAQVLVTVHPSYLLRLQGSAERAEEMARFVADLQRAQLLVSRAA